MTNMSRRALARYTAKMLVDGESASAVAPRLAAAIVASHLTKEVDSLLGDIAWELEQQGELAISKVTSARPLSRELENQLIGEIKKAVGARAVTVEKLVDKSVIGGVRIETSGRVWDCTIARKLTQLREAF